MPYVPDDMEEKDPNAPAPGQRSAVGSSGGGGGGGFAAKAAQAAPRAQTPFVNLSSYLAANRQGAEAQAQKAVNPVQQLGTQTNAGVGTQMDKFGNAVRLGTVQGGVVRQEGVTASNAPDKPGTTKVEHVELPGTTGPGSTGQTVGYDKEVPDQPATHVYNTPANSLSVAGAEAQTKKTYSGPKSVGDMDKTEWGRLSGNAESVGASLGQMGNQGGREDIIRQQNQGYMSPFARALAGYTMGQAGGQQFQGLRNQFQGLSGMLNNRQGESVKTAGDAVTTSEKNVAGWKAGLQGEKDRVTKRMGELALTPADYSGSGGGATFDVPYEQYAAAAKAAGRPVATKAEWESARPAPSKDGSF